MSKQRFKQIRKRIVAGLMSFTMLMGPMTADGSLVLAARKGQDENIVAADNLDNKADNKLNASDADYVISDEESANDILTQLQDEFEETEVILEGSDEKDELSVSVTGELEVLGDAADIIVEPIDDISAWQNAIDTIEDGLAREVIAVYDISLVDDDGNEIEPDGSVSVSFTGDVVSDVIKDDRAVEVYHLPNGSTELENVYAREYSSDLISFSTEGFSSYALTLREGENTQIEQELSEDFDERFEMDKYLEVKNYEINGQPAANIFIEQAYYSNDKTAVQLEKAPVRTDLILMIDATASMMGRIQHQNEYIFQFLRAIMKINRDRQQKARDGGYSDFVYTDENALNEFMKQHYIYIDAYLRFNNHLETESKISDPIAILTKQDYEPIMKSTCDAPNKGCGQPHALMGLNGESLKDENGNDWYVKATDKCTYTGFLSRTNQQTDDTHGSLQSMTRTDLASEQALKWVKDIRSAHPETQIGLLMLTDGAPYGSGESGSIYYSPIKSWMFVGTANVALNYANQMKAAPYNTTIYVGFDSPDYNKNNLYAGLKASKPTHFKPADKNLYLENDLGKTQTTDIYFMALYSSGYLSGKFTDLTAPSKAGGGDELARSVTIDTVNPDIKIKFTGGGNYSFQYSGSGNMNDYIIDIDGSNFVYPFMVGTSASDLTSYNTFCDYYWLMTPSDAHANAAKVQEIAGEMDKSAIRETNSSGYASADSYILDEITDPFMVQNINDIRVYKVPRIPKDLGPDNIPNGLDSSLGCDNTVDEAQKLDSGAFRWGERSVDMGDDAEGGSEWIDITDQVTIDASLVEQNVVRISGFDYEHGNAVHDFDIDYLRAANDPNNNGLAYKTGDYGYKLVVEIPIVAKTTFGGNNIMTNNTDVSGFYPSDPDGELIKRDPWYSNTAKNPNKNPYIGLYPACKMNLKVNYKVVKDFAYIYAPQTEKLRDILVDSKGYPWFVSDGYYDTLNAINFANEELNTLFAELEATEQALAESSELPEGTRSTADINVDIGNKREEIDRLNEEFNKMTCYIPDGIRNAFVDIKYSVKSPSGVEVATMNIPHGTAFYETYDDEGHMTYRSIDWTIVGGPDTIITESGKYTLTATVTPVSTRRSKSWHVYTDVDGDDIKIRAENEKSTDCSPTGSDGVDASPNTTFGDIGPSKGSSVTEFPEAYIYQLKITVNDTSKETGQNIDVNYFQRESTLPTTALFTTGAGMTHIVSYEWYCTVAGAPKPSEPIGEAVTMVTTTIPESIIVNEADVGEGKTYKDDEAAYKAGKLVKEVGGLLAIIAPDGAYVPIATKVERKFRDINKDAEDTESYSEYVLMTDSDNVYGPGKHSIIWEHVCGLDEHCNDADGDFAKAVKKYSEGDNVIHYLIHMFANIPPIPVKSATEGTTISVNDTFKWTISTSNTNDSDKTKQDYNINHRASSYTLVDILPHENDQRTTLMYGDEAGSYFHGILKYTSIKIDFSKAPAAKQMLSSGAGKMYYTNSDLVYQYPASDKLRPSNIISGESEIGTITWTPVNQSTIIWNGDIATFSGFESTTVYAFKLDTTLSFGESIIVYIEADTTVAGAKKDGDYATNEAYVYNGTGFTTSEQIAIDVAALAISGYVWFDGDFDGLKSPTESGISNISLGLYRVKGDPNETIATVKKRYTSPVSLELISSYNADLDVVNNVMTGADGAYSFTNLNPGTYYIIADCLPDDVTLVKKRVKGDARAANELDSEAEEYFLDNGNNTQYNKTAYIANVALGVSGNGSDNFVTGMNIGVCQMLGSIRVGKIADNLHIPATLTDEQRADYKVPIVFYAKNTETGIIYTKSIILDQDTFESRNGKPQEWVTFENLPLGKYEVWESYTNGNTTTIETEDSSVTPGNGKATVTLTTTKTDAEFWFKNTVSSGTPSYNMAGMHLPVKLTLIYVGPEIIGMDSNGNKTNASQYVFQYSDFDPAKGGDIIVTYDDGTTRKLSEDPGLFAEIKFSPGSSDNPITRFMNTGTDRTSKPLPVTGYYMEKGQLVTDVFSVKVALKELKKFTVWFDCNYLEDDSGSAFAGIGRNQNKVTFLYDEDTGQVEVASGVYKSTANNGLGAPAYKFGGGSFTQMGWNTERTGTGVQSSYDNDINNALKSIGAAMSDPSWKYGNDVVWYALWAGNVTFYANGTLNLAGNAVENAGTLTKGTTAGEQGASGKDSYTVRLFKGQPITTGLEGVVSNPAQEAFFDHWNRQFDNWGEDLDKTNPPAFRGGENFYAVYYVTEFKYIGKGDAFRAPNAGSYTFKLWGSPGGNVYGHTDYANGKGIGGRGGYVDVTIDLNRNQTVYAFVGSAGAAIKGDACAGGYNGGGPGIVCGAGPHSASGGGATHISFANNPIISDVFVKVKGAKDTESEDENDRSEEEADSYTYDTIIMNYGSSIKGKSQSELMTFARDKLKTHPFWGSYITNSTEILELGSKHGYNSSKTSRSNNGDAWFLFKCHTWANTNQVIAVAGGGGGGSQNDTAKKNPYGKSYGFAGGEEASSGYLHDRHKSYRSAMKTASNKDNRGYTQGSGQYNTCSSGSGGGWWGGYSSTAYGTHVYQTTSGGHCGDIGAGGTSYIHEANDTFRITASTMIAGNSDQLDSGTYLKPQTEGVNGYIKVTKNF